MSAPELDHLLAHGDVIPSLPEIVHHLIRSLDDELADVDTLAHHINADPAIVGRLLAAANSAAFGLSTRIDSARQAFLVLGIKRVSDIILGAALLDRYHAGTPHFDARLLWRHTFGVAVCARVIAETIGENPEAAFTAGLLHDIGQLLMVAAAPADYGRALTLHQNEDLPILDAERAVFGYDHAQAGGRLADFWRLPRNIGEAIAGHHDPDGFDNPLGDLVHLAEALAHALDLGELPNNRVPHVSERACAQLGVRWNDLVPRFAEIEARYDGLRIALAL
jgi:putative nucleotidyltransferase with HDIG domain